MTSAVYVAGKLTVPGGCPICSGVLSLNLKCQRYSCSKHWASLAEIQEAYALVKRISALSPTAQDALDAARYRWLRSVGGRTWTHLEKQAPAVGDNYDNLVDDAMIQQESAK